MNATPQAIQNRKQNRAGGAATQIRPTSTNRERRERQTWYTHSKLTKYFRRPSCKPWTLVSLVDGDGLMSLDSCAVAPRDVAVRQHTWMQPRDCLSPRKHRRNFLLADCTDAIFCWPIAGRGRWRRRRCGRDGEDVRLPVLPGGLCFACVCCMPLSCVSQGTWVRAREAQQNGGLHRASFLTVHTLFRLCSMVHTSDGDHNDTRR